MPATGRLRGARRAQPFSAPPPVVAPHAAAAPGAAPHALAGRRQRLRRAAWRRAVLAVHLWVGLGAGLVLSVVGVTGSLYVFAPEITAALNPDLFAARPPAGRTAPLPTLELARRTAAAAAGRGPEAIESVQWPQRDRVTFQFKLFGDDAWYFVDPFTGRVLGRDVDRPSAGAMGWLLEVHTSLGLGERGRWIVGASALLLALVLVSTGVWLWWPRTAARRRSALRVDLAAPPARRMLDLHSVAGVYAAVPLVALALTGAVWSFPEAARGVADRLTGSAPLPADYSDAQSSAPAGRRPLTLAEVLVRTEREFPGYHRRNLWMAGDSTGALYLSWIRDPRGGAGGEYRPMLFLDRHTGATLVRYDPDRASRGTRLLNVWFPPVHFGEVGGLPTRVMVFATGLVPLALTLTGAQMWRRRRARQALRA